MLAGRVHHRKEQDERADPAEIEEEETVRIIEPSDSPVVEEKKTAPVVQETAGAGELNEGKIT